MIKNKSWFLIIVAIVVIIAMFSGCLYDPEETDPNDNTSAATNSTESSVISDTTSDTSATTTEAPESTEATTTLTTTSTSTTTTEATTEATTTKAETKAERDYVLNTNTMKFHYPTCSSVEDIKTNNREDYHGTREDVVAQGYSPCGRCKP